jgi:phage terminase large subunit GpA-like protein
LDEVQLSNLPTVAELCKRLNRVPFGIVPSWATLLTGFVDVGSNSGFHWAVCGWRQGFGGAVVAWGREMLPESDATVDAKVYAMAEGIAETLCGHEWKTENGTAMRLARCPYDSGWGEQAGTIYSFCRQTKHAAIVCPSKGESSKRGYVTYKPGAGIFVGDHLRVSPLKIGEGNIRLLLYDANYWKSFLFSRLTAGMGDKSALTFCCGKERDIEPIATQLTSEYRTKMQNVEKGLEFDLWSPRPSRYDNHWLDCLVGNCVAAGVSGITLQSAYVAAQGGSQKPAARVRASYD